MNLTELKKKTMPQLLEIAESMNLDNLARSRKQDVIFLHPESTREKW